MIFRRLLYWPCKRWGQCGGYLAKQRGRSNCGGRGRSCLGVHWSAAVHVDQLIAAARENLFNKNNNLIFII